MDVELGLSAEHGIVGWYHSHPGLGVFLSPRDRFIQSHFFGQPWQVAAVFDPLGEAWGLFGWEEGDIVPFGGCYLYGPASDAALIDSEAQRASRWLAATSRDTRVRLDCP